MEKINFEPGPLHCDVENVAVYPISSLNPCLPFVKHILGSTVPAQITKQITPLKHNLC